MMIDIDPAHLHGLVREWLKDALQCVETNAGGDYVHPDDVKTHKKDIKALRRLLDYIGEVD